MVSTSKAGSWLANGERALVYAVGADHDAKAAVMNFPNVNSAAPCPLGVPDMSTHVHLYRALQTMATHVDFKFISKN